MRLIHSDSIKRTDDVVGMACYSMFNHLMKVANLHAPEINFETAIKIPQNPFQVHTAAFFHNMRLAALENNFCNLLIYLYYESASFEQFKRLSPFLGEKNHKLFDRILNPFQKIDDQKALDVFQKFVTKFNRNMNFDKFIKVKVYPVMRTFKIHEEPVTNIFTQSEPVSSLH